MKRMNNIIKSGAFMLLTALSFTACTDKNDWDVDRDYERLFSVSKIDISAQAREAEVSWASSPNAEYYIVELSKDTLYNDIEMGSNASSVIYGENKEITRSPIIFNNLDGNTKYFVRIKALSSAIAESNWAYPEKYSFKTSVEQILNPVREITHNSALISWNSEKAVDNYLLYVEEETEGTQYSISESEKEEGQLILEELEENTNYKIEIRLGETVRGTRAFTTTQDGGGGDDDNYPEGYTVVELSLEDDFLEVLAVQSGKVVMVLPQGSDISISSPLDYPIPAAIESIIFWGEQGEEKPKFSPKGMVAAESGNFDLIKFYNLDLYSAGAGGDYIFNQNRTATIKTISISNCIVRDMRGVVRIQGGGTTTRINTVELNNNIIKNIGDMALINIAVATCSLNNAIISNSTIISEAGRILDFNNMEGITATIDQCTFYKACGSEFIRLKENAETTLAISNSILGTAYDNASIKGANKAGFITFDNVYFTSDLSWSSSTNRFGTLYDATSNELFMDPANIDFRIKDEDFPGKYNCGDPRWIE